MNTKLKDIWFLFLIPLVFVGWYFYNRHEQKPIRTLPYYGRKNTIKPGDTVFHAVGAFSLTDQYGERVTEARVKHKIYVTDFFFTTCHSICPVMSTQLERVYKAFEKDSTVMILSHTVDPEEDSASVMLAYARMHGVKDHRWLFLTGDKKDLYELARNSYLLNAEEGDGGPDDFIHTQNFALADKDRHLRGFYDGTDSAEVSRLITDIKVLEDEYAYKEKNH